MGYASKVNEPGYTDVVIDGVAFQLPKRLQYMRARREAIFESMSGDRFVDATYAGAGFPNVIAPMSFELPYDTDDTNSTLTEALETLYAQGGVHDFYFGKQFVHIFTLAIGQAVIYIPRRDAFALAYAGATTAVVTLGGVAVTVVYKNSVTESTVVDAGELWISKASTTHPKTGKLAMLAKLGTPPVTIKDLLMKFYPVFRTVVRDVTTDFPMTGREDKVLYLDETN